MTKKAYFIVGLCVICATASALAQQLLMGPSQQARGLYVPDQIIVKFKAGVAEQAIEAINAKMGTSHISTSRRGFRVLRINGRRTVEELIAKYKADPSVEHAEPDYIAYAYMTPNDPYFPYQWHLDNQVNGGIHATAAWDITTGDPSVIVAVLGTGVAYENYSQTVGFRTYRYYAAPDLRGTRFVAGWDFINNDAHANDDNGHETHVCGTIAQTTNNGIGVAGIAFSTTIMPVKVLGADGSGSYSAVANGIIWAADRGAKIVNMSLGGPSPSVMLEDACRYAYERGVTLICAAGNENRASIGYPAAYNNYCIAVGAVRFDQTRAPYSNYGPGLDIVAPGGDVNVDQNGDGYGDGVLQLTFGSPRYVNRTYHYDTWGYYFYQGTSMAAPHVTGVAALVMASGVASTPEEIREVLQATAKDLGEPGYDPVYGWGLVDAVAALNYSPTVNLPPVADAGGPYEGIEDEPVVFNGSASSDPENAPLTFSWDFGDGSSGSGVTPTHTYTAGGTYTVTLVVSDGQLSSAPSVTSVYIAEVNDLPIANAGDDITVQAGKQVIFDGSGSYDPDGSIASYEWNFGDGTGAVGETVLHTYWTAGAYTVTLRVTDNSGASAEDIAVVTVKPAEIEVFSDGFNVAEWNGLWTEDSQNDWSRSSKRSVEGGWSAEVCGPASNAQLVSIPIDLQGRLSATVTFSWFIETTLDANEYVAVDISTNGGSTWIEKARLRGNVDPEGVWHVQTIEVTAVSNALRLRFRGKMSASDERAYVDAVKVLAR